MTTAQEQYIIELVNRARLDPAGEAARLGIDLNEGLAPGTISSAAKDPLAGNNALDAAALGHSQHMDAVDVMAHDGIGDGTITSRISDAHYPLSGTWYDGENIAWVGTSGTVNESTAAYQNYANLFVDSFQSDRGHRLNILSDNFREIGVGEVVGTMKDSNGQLWNAAILTQDFGKHDTAYFITGVAYNDTNGNSFYDIGEGHGGVTVTVTGAGSAPTEGAGGYSVAYAGGDATVTFSGGGLSAPVSVMVEGGAHSVKVDLIGNNTVTSSQNATLGANAQNLILLGSDDLHGTGNALNNSITGNSAANGIDGGAGADTMTGGLGNDTYYVDNSGDKVVEKSGEGVDTVISSVSYSLGAYVENLTLTGTANINATGTTYGNVIVGNDGNNVIDGGAGADTMTGGKGNDTYYVDNAGDKVVEHSGEGVDTVISSVSYSLGSYVENLTLTGTANINATGTGYDNVIVGNGGNNVIDGGAGADTMTGGKGNDTYYVDNTGDKVVEKSGEGVDTVVSTVSYKLVSYVENVTLAGSANIDATGTSYGNIITGNDGFNTLKGMDGNDTIYGGGGNDFIVGGKGHDTMFGGDGNDRFDFASLTEMGKTASSRDVIGDFQHSFDDIDLSTIDAQSGKSGNQAFSFIGTKAFGGHQGELHYVTSGANTLIEGDVNGDKHADFQIQLNGHIALTAIDFVL